MEKLNYDELFCQVLSVEQIEDEALARVEDVEKKVQEEVLKKYSELVDKHDKLRMSFSSISNRGSLYFYENGVAIILSVNGLDAQLRSIADKGRIARQELLGRDYDVRVLGVKEGTEELCPAVFVTCRFENEVVERRREARKAINQMIDNRDRTKLPAKVILVNERRREVLLDICGYGIKGVCSIKNWGNSVSPMVLAGIKPGTVTTVSVIGRPSRGGATAGLKNGAFVCSRKSDNAFAGISKKYPQGTTVKARLVTINKDKGYGFFHIDGFDDAEIMCYFPWDRDKTFKQTTISKMVVGRMYIIVVNKVDEAKKIFRGRVVQEIATADDLQAFERAAQAAEKNSSIVAEVERPVKAEEVG